MNQSEFDGQMNRLRSHFVTTKHYSDDFCRMLWLRVMKLQDGVMRKMADEFIQNSRQAPLMPEFMELSARFARSLRPTTKFFKSTCKECNGMGYFLVTHFETGSSAVASCDKCVTGAELRNSQTHPVCSLSSAKSYGYFEPKTLIPADEEKWVSTQCPGIHPAIEAVCEGIKTGKLSNEQMNSRMIYLGFKSDQMWAVFDAWVDGKIHESVKDFTFKLQNLGAQS